MPRIYLSPSLQEFNPYVNGGNEEYYMNLIADAMQPYLTASGIQFDRNDPEQSLGQVIRDSNAGNYDLHFAIHSNASPAPLEGRIKGVEVYYYQTSQNGKRLADIIAQNYKAIYPNPDLVKTVPTTTLAELRRTKAPAILIETAYHDNVEDAQWIRDNIGNIARNLVLSITEYFGIPFIEPQEAREGIVATQSTALNIRQKPSLTAAIIDKAPKGAKLKVLGEYQNFYVVNYNSKDGYASKDYIKII